MTAFHPHLSVSDLVYLLSYYIFILCIFPNLIHLSFFGLMFFLVLSLVLSGLYDVVLMMSFACKGLLIVSVVEICCVNTAVLY